MSEPPFEILFEDNHCLAVVKPAGIACAHFQGKAATLDQQVKAYLKEKYDKPGQVFLGIVHRLDKPVSGVMIFARTSKAAARLSEQFRKGSIEKVYWAVVEGTVEPSAGSLEDWLRKEEEQRRVAVVEPTDKGAKQALLHFQRRALLDDLSWLEVRPQTGRRHQLRAQLAHHGYPIFGDAKYGSIRIMEDSIALHARALTFLHPIRYEPITLTADVPRLWRRKFAYLMRGKI